jgi:hypothetical protein
MTSNIVMVGVGAALAVSLVGARAADKKSVDLSKIPQASTKSGVTYATDIKPMFDKSCTRCHDGDRPKAKLRLDSLEGVLKGGEDGKVIKPGDSAGSMLVHNIARAGDPDDYMPPPRNKAGIQPLTKEQIGLIRAWIDQGVK